MEEEESDELTRKKAQLFDILSEVRKIGERHGKHDENKKEKGANLLLTKEKML